MKWQINYALQALNDGLGRSEAEHLSGEIIKISTQGKPDVIAAISDTITINKEIVEHYAQLTPNIDFLCGYRKECVWEGDAITLLEANCIGWGNYGTLSSAVTSGNANIAEHKTFSFAARLIHQYGIVKSAKREYDRVFRVKLKSGREFRVGMIEAYEPTADNVRSLWQRFGPVDIAWNINPNGTPSKSSQRAGEELGCKVLKTEGLKAYMQSL